MSCFTPMHSRLRKFVPAVLKQINAAVFYPVRRELLILLAGILDRLELLMWRDEKTERLSSIRTGRIFRQRCVDNNEEISRLACVKFANENVGTDASTKLHQTCPVRLGLKPPRSTAQMPREARSLTA